MAGASVETTLELWASSLRDVKARIRPLFSQERVAVSAGEFLDGLLGNEPRKTGWMRAEAAGDSGPWRQQAILGRGRWDADALREIVREYALAWLASARIAGHARLRHDGRYPSSRQRRAAQKNTASPSQWTPLLICCWSVQEIRRIAIKLTQKRIQPAHVIAWSLWQRAHQAEARRAHLKRKMQL